MTEPKLRYFNSGDEIREGDRVEYTTLILRRRKSGTVVCVPEKTALELNAEKKPPEDWLLRFDDGTYTGWMYYPEELSAPKRLRLIGRGSDYQRVTGDELEEWEAKDAEQAGWRDDLLGCGVIIGLAILLVLLLAVVKYGLPW